MTLTTRLSKHCIRWHDTVAHHDNRRIVMLIVMFELEARSTEMNQERLRMRE